VIEEVPPNSGTFAFTVEDYKGNLHDVYRFRKDGKRGTMAFTRINEKFLLSIFTEGYLNQLEAKKKIDEAMRDDA
jgi:hypothetical protein